MFNPNLKRDRLNYGTILIPPSEYHLEKAVGTTYSLDLETLIAVSISLGLKEDTDSKFIEHPFLMLDALRKVSDKITIFCDAGQIKFRQKKTELCILLEKMIVPVAPKPQNGLKYPAFHPKMWLLEYVNEKNEKKYRFIILSRNLTFDHSWDIACTMEGEEAPDTVEESKPLIDFLCFLEKQLDENSVHYSRQKEDLSYFINKLSKIRFKADNNAFSSFTICPLGIGDKSHKMHDDPLFKENFHRLVVMSPFLTSSIIKGLNNTKNLTGTKRTLITRRTELQKIIDDSVANNFDVYVMKDDVVNGESKLSDGENQAEEIPHDQDIHAKIFIREKNGSIDCYIGSMNASKAAIEYNVELVLKLHVKGNRFNGEQFLNEVMGEDKNSKLNPFELINLQEVTKEENEKTAEDKAEEIIKTISRHEMKATVSSNGDLFNVTITVNGINEKLKNAKISLFFSDQESDLLSTITFNALEVSKLSEFYILSVTVDNFTLKRVIKIPTSNLPERESKIIKSVISDENVLIDYIAFILGDDYTQSLLEKGKKKSNSSDQENENLNFAIYEQMLKASAYSPEKIAEIIQITEAVNKEGIENTKFNELYQTFRDLIKSKE